GAHPNRLSPRPLTNSEYKNYSYRHTLQVPKAPTTRTSRDFSFAGSPSEDVLSATGRFSPTQGETPHRRRASLSLVRRPTRSTHPDPHVDEVPQDEDAMR